MTARAGTRRAKTDDMLSLLSNLFLGRRRSGLLGFFDRRRRGGIVNGVNNHRRATAVGTLASIAAPFLIRKVMARRAQNASARA
jgi:hypothetical protein